MKGKFQYRTNVLNAVGDDAAKWIVENLMNMQIRFNAADNVERF